MLIFILNLLNLGFCITEEEHMAKMIGKPPPPKDMIIETLYDPEECEMTTKVGNEVKVINFKKYISKFFNLIYYFHLKIKKKYIY